MLSLCLYHLDRKNVDPGERYCDQLWAQSEFSFQAHDGKGVVYGVDVGSCPISNLIIDFSSLLFFAQEDDQAQTIKYFQVSGFPLTITRVCQLGFQFAYVNDIPGSSEKQVWQGENG